MELKTIIAIGLVLFILGGLFPGAASHRYPGGDGGNPWYYCSKHPGGALCSEQGAGRPEQNPKRQAGRGTFERGRRKRELP